MCNALDMPCGARGDLDHIEAKLYRIRLRIYRFCASKNIDKIPMQSLHRDFCSVGQIKSGRTDFSVRPLYSGLPPVEGKKARRSKGSKRRREEKKP
jgi:hypothetical protein